MSKVAHLDTATGAPASGPAALREPEPETPGRRPALRHSMSPLVAVSSCALSKGEGRGASAPKPGALVRLLLDWFAQNARDLPWRRTRDPYAIWVSEIMLQQTQVKTVLPYYERWMRELPTIRALAEAPVDRIHKLWDGLGYYTRVRNLQKAAQLI